MSKKSVTKGKKVVQEVQVKPDIMPLEQRETLYFQELVQTSNTYSKLMGEKAKFESLIKQLTTYRTQIQKGQIKLPLQMTIIPNMISYLEDDKKKILKQIDDVIDSYQNALKGVIGQLEHRKEEFIESGLRNCAFLQRRFAGYQEQTIVPDRKSTKGEDVLFEAEFDDLVKNPTKQKELKEAKITAAKKNVARKTKK